MLRTIPNTTTYFPTHGRARIIVDALNADDDAWTYVVGESHDGKYMIQVYDEEGFLLGTI